MRPSDSIAGRAGIRASTRWLIAACLLGCATEPAVDQLPADQQFVARAWPALGRCVGCHATQPSIDFLAPGTAMAAYATLFAFQPPIVDLESPASSLLLTMGKHTGPPLAAEEVAALLGWLEAERLARVPDPGMPIAIGPVTLSLGATNTVDLGPATLRFVPTAAASGVSLSHLALIAGARRVHVVHPLFASHPRVGPTRIDVVDTFGDVDLDLAPGMVAPLGGGEALFPAFAPADPITIHFRTLEAP
jgi:hypothetical protein